MDFSKILLLICLVVTPITSASSREFQVSQIPEMPSFDDKTYLGLEYGSAGISLAILEVLFLSNVNDNVKNLAFEIALTALENLWDSRVEYEGIKYPTWERSIEEQYKSVYPGMKYGAPGIIRAFLKLYDITDDPKWLDRAEESYWYLSSQAINESTYPHWPYHYTLPKEDVGVAITDLKYGSAAVLSTSLELYKITQKQEYLDHGKLIISWLDKISVINEVNTINYKIIPWYFMDGSTNSDRPVYTSYGFGIAGIIPQLYQYGLSSQTQNQLDWAIELANFLSNIQLEDGSWYVASDEELTFNVGFDNGVAGVLNGMMELKSLSNSTEYDQVISKGVNWLFTRYVANTTHMGFYNIINNQNNIEITNSLYDGNLGVLRTLFKLESFLTPIQSQLLIQLYQWLITSGSFFVTNGGVELLFLKESIDNDQSVDFSYAQGLAGFISELTQLEQNQQLSAKINFNISRAIVAAVNTFEYFQQTNGHWQRQYVIPMGWNINHFTISDFTKIEVPLNNFTNAVETNITEKNNKNSSERIEYIYYLIPLIMVIPILYTVKKLKFSKK
ncbi:MAG: hypothetical protein ACW99Q_07660 [Candidatus Kariarchaeaceae archaeon]